MTKSEINTLVKISESGEVGTLLADLSKQMEFTLKQKGVIKNKPVNEGHSDRVILSDLGRAIVSRLPAKEVIEIKEEK